MERWVLFAFTSVIAKQGLTGISGDLGLVVRTCYVFVLVLGFGAPIVPRAELANLTAGNFLWLGLSSVTTAASWVFYKALKAGEVSTVALIDKESFVVAVVLA